MLAWLDMARRAVDRASLVACATVGLSCASAPTFGETGFALSLYDVPPLSASSNTTPERRVGLGPELNAPRSIGAGPDETRGAPALSSSTSRISMVELPPDTMVPERTSDRITVLPTDGERQNPGCVTTGWTHNVLPCQWSACIPRSDLARRAALWLYGRCSFR